MDPNLAPTVARACLVIIRNPGRGDRAHMFLQHLWLTCFGVSTLHHLRLCCATSVALSALTVSCDHHHYAGQSCSVTMLASCHCDKMPETNNARGGEVYLSSWFRFTVAWPRWLWAQDMGGGMWWRRALPLGQLEGKREAGAGGAQDPLRGHAPVA